MTISITQEDINLGIKKNREKCAVARACARAGLKNPFVTIYYIYYDGKAWGFAENVTQWICDYDNEKEVSEIKFDIDYILPIT